MRRPFLPTLVFIATSLCLIPVTGALYVGVDYMQTNMLPRPFESTVTLRPASGDYRSITLHAQGEIQPQQSAAERCRLTLALTHQRGVVSVLVIDVTSNAHSIGRLVNLPGESARADVFLPTAVGRWLQRERLDIESPTHAAELNELILAMRFCGQGETSGPWPLTHFEQRLCGLHQSSAYPELNWTPPACAGLMFIATVITYIRRTSAKYVIDFGDEPTMSAGRIAF